MIEKVTVSLVCREEVEIEVERNPDESPLDLSLEEERKAFKKASAFTTWEVEDVFQ